MSAQRTVTLLALLLCLLIVSGTESGVAPGAVATTTPTTGTTSSTGTATSGTGASGTGSSAPGGSGTPSGAAPVVVSPAPGSRTADPSTQISFLGVGAGAIGTVTVTGSRSGAHPGKLEPYAAGDGASFVPDQPFLAGEQVTVRTSLDLAGAPGGTFSFRVARVVALDVAPSVSALRTDVPGVQHFVSAPGLTPPSITVDVPEQAKRGGDFLLAPKGTTGSAGPMIVNGSGGLVWFHPLSGTEEAFDLNEQTYLGKPVLTWFQGNVVDGHGEGEGVIESTSYRTVAIVHAGNGVEEDLHELQLGPDGTALITAYRTMRWDLASDGGSTEGTVFDGVVQEIDVRTGLVMYEWDSLDHVPVSDSYFEAPKAADSPFDYFHVNSIQQLAGGDLLVSGRNTSAAYEISPEEAGAIVFELGGKHSSFAMGAGTRFWYQHDVRELSDGDFTVFDDGASPTREPRSRALVLQVDQTSRRVTLLHAYVHPGNVLATALGNVQSLPHGRLVVSWGTSPYLSELSSTGALLFDAELPAGDDTYRVYRDVWNGTPASPPAIATRAGGKGKVSVYASWNGATDVASWRVLGGASRSSLRRLATVADRSFETVTEVAREPYVQVQALSSRGKVLASSAVVTG